jgi:hypothetical protein
MISPKRLGRRRCWWRGNDIGYSWMGQFFRRLIGCFGLSSPPAHQNITQVVRILPSPPAWIGVRLGHAKPQCFGDSRDSKNDSIWAARRVVQRRRRHAPSQHGRYRRPKELARNAKNPGRTRVLERRGQEPNFSVFSLCFVIVRKALHSSGRLEEVTT